MCANCFFDLFGYVETSLNDSMQSGEIERKISFLPSVGESIITREAHVELKNGSESNYKTFMRVFSGKDSKFKYAKIYDENEILIREIVPETYEGERMRDAGVFISLKPQESKRVVFKWETEADLNFDKPGKVKTIFVKQPGMGKFPLQVRYKMPVGLKYSIETDTLTNVDSFGYNTFMSRDFTSTVFWK